MNSLVSIISPCYNGEKYIHRLLDSILKQTYPNIEVIVINDGSIDKTQDIIDKYKNLFTEKHIAYYTLYQENQGQAVALQYGLQFCHGTYITWPDADDFYINHDAIRIMVSTLQNSSEDISMTRCLPQYVKETETGGIEMVHTSIKHHHQSSLFRNCIFEHQFWSIPGCFMCKADILKIVNPTLTLYPSRGGQNWQMCLPLLYNKKCITINKKLFGYLLRDNSHSKCEKNEASILERYQQHKEILIETIKSMLQMNETEKKYWIYNIEKKYERRFFETHIYFNNLEQATQQYKILKKKKINRIIDFINLRLIKYNSIRCKINSIYNHIKNL